jgi:hypothetical protein
MDGHSVPRLRRRSGQDDAVPASHAQARLWFLDRLHGSSAEYNMPALWRLRGPLDVRALDRAIQTIVARHESLRTRFVEIGGQPFQRVEPRQRIDLPIDDLRSHPEGPRQAAIEAAARQQAETPFDLATGPLLRVRLLRTGEEEHLLFLTVHHIVFDAWSEGVFTSELFGSYDAARHGRAAALPPLAVQYPDFTLWQREWLEGPRLEAGLRYWRQQLAHMPDRLTLPMDRPRRLQSGYAAGACRVQLAADELGAVAQSCQQQQATPYMMMLAAYGVLLARYCGQVDILVGSAIANRPFASLQSVIGFFVNMLLMRLRVDADAPFASLLAGVRETALAAYQHQDVPLERILDALAPVRDPAAPPIYRVGFTLLNVPAVPPRLPDLQVERISTGHSRVHSDLELHAWLDAKGLTLILSYNRELFERWRIEQMLRHYTRILLSVARQPAQRVGHIPLLDEDERRDILGNWGRGAATA